MAPPPPAGLPPPSKGPAPDRGPQLMALAWVLTIAACFTVLLRFSIRARKHVFGWDDIFMLIAMLCFFGWTITLTFFSLQGGERHIWDVAVLGPDTVARVQLLNWTAQVFGIMGVGAGKVSVSALLLAILRNTTRSWQTYYLWTFCIVLVVLVSTSCSILTFTQCIPAAAIWDTRVEGKCIDPQVMADYGIFTGSYNTFVDASLAFIPSTIFWSLQMDVTEKMQLSIVFAFNILTSICSAIKTSYLSQLANREDLTWATYDIFAWVTAEFFLIIVCGTVPTLKPGLVFVQRHLGIYASKLTGNSYQRHTNDKSPMYSEDIVQLNALRGSDGTSSHTAVSNNYPEHSTVPGNRTGHEKLPEHIRVERSYDVQVA